MNYPDEVFRFYNALAKQNISADIIGTDTQLEKYKILFAPVLYMVKPGYAEKLTKFVNDGGILVTGYFSGMTDERDLVTLGGYPGELRSLCGLWVEETDALLPDNYNGFVIKGTGKYSSLNGTWKADLLCDIIHPEGAETIAVYQSDFYAGTPALCCNNFGKGQVWYFGSRPEADFVENFILYLCGESGIQSVFPVPIEAEGIEATCRVKDGKEFIFVLNHNMEDVEIDIPFACRDLLTEKSFASSDNYLFPAAGVMILVKD
jgi:beta-galactosidase